MLRTAKFMAAAGGALMLTACGGGPSTDQMGDAIIDWLAGMPSFEKTSDRVVTQTMPFGMNQMHWTLASVTSRGCKAEGKRYVCDITPVITMKVTDGQGVVDEYSGAVQRMMAAFGATVSMESGMHTFEKDGGKLRYIPTP